MRSKNPSILTLVVLFAIIFVLGKSWPTISSALMPATNPTPPTSIPAVNLPVITPVQNLKPLELPANGETHYYLKAEAIAPLNISTGSDRNYFIKLIDKSTGQVAVTVFVRGGQFVNIKMPLGLYEFRYASGTQWYGEEQLFGPGTDCQKADKVFDFYRNGSQIMGHTVQLIKQVNGNLPTTSVSKNSF